MTDTVERTYAWKVSNRSTSILVDNDSWVLPYALKLADKIRYAGDHCSVVRSSNEIPSGTVCFFIGCINIVPKSIRLRNEFNLVVHASDLPGGRGFSPLSWSILSGMNKIPVCLLEADDEVDSGSIYAKALLEFEGDELISDLREKLGEVTISLCENFLASKNRPVGVPQIGKASWFPKRTRSDSELDPNLSIANQFNLLRIVDNAKYPAFFTFRGKTYRLLIEKVDE